MKFTIKGEPRVKKNSQQIIYKNGRPLIIQNKRYLDFEEQCLWQIGKAYRQQIDFPVNVQYVFYRGSKRKVDLTNLMEAMDDILVKANVLTDDNRDVIAKHDGSIVLYDKENPRIEVTIEELIGYVQWKENK